MLFDVAWGSFPPSHSLTSSHLLGEAIIVHLACCCLRLAIDVGVTLSRWECADGVLLMAR